MTSETSENIKRELYSLLGEVTCRSRKIAAIIVQNGVIIGSGTNNPTCDCIKNAHKRGYNPVDDGHTCVRYLLGAKSGELLSLCNATHAERNAIQSAHKKGYNLRGSVMYMTCECPCNLCAGAIVSSGIKQVVIKDYPDYDPRGRKILTEGGVTIKTWVV